MLSALLDGLAVLRADWLPVLALLTVPLGLGLALTHILPGLRERAWIAIPFAWTAGLPLLALPGFALVLLGRLWFPLLRFGAWALAGVALLSLLREGIFAFRREGLKPGAIGLPALLALLLLRLAFLKDLLLPPYSDSAEHVLIIQDFLTPGGTGLAAHGLTNLLRLYYHVGAHAIVAWLSILTGADPARALALLGQIALTLAPLSVFALTGWLTDDRRAAWIAALLSAFGWALPAFAANWGKYPLLTALACLPSVCLAWLASADRRPRAASIVLSLGAIFLHSRMLILLIILAAAWSVSRLLIRRKDPPPWPLSLLLAVVLAALVLLPRDLTRASLLMQVPATLGALLLATFAFKKHLRPAGTLLLTVAGMELAAVLPFPEVGSGYGQNWLDQPFLDISLHLPLAILGGLGLGGLFSLTASRPAAAAGLTLLLIALLIWNASRFPFHAHPCCTLVRNSDLAAMDWLRENLPPGSPVLIATAPAFDTDRPVDAGAWIPALTGLPVRRWPYDFDWRSQQAREQVCQTGASIVYAGSAEIVFNRSQLEYLPWAQVVFRRNRVTLYHLTCP